MSKKKFRVFKRYYYLEDCDSPSGGYYRHEVWEFVGETLAVSEKQAINNVRYRRKFPSQCRPVANGCRWENGFEWAAKEAEQ